MVGISWLADVEQGFEQARSEGKMVLIEFTLAPQCAGCNRLEADVYPQATVETTIGKRFVPVRIHFRERPQDRRRFNVVWTPTVILADADGTECHRIVGFLPVNDFLAHLHLGLAKAAFGQDRFEESQQAFQEIVRRHSQTDAAPEAVYWAGVSEYKRTHERQTLTSTGERLRDQYPTSEWAKKGSVWLG